MKRLPGIRVRWTLGVALGLGLAMSLMTGCTPGRFLARRIAQAPNSYPQWFAPKARVILTYEEELLSQFPLQKLSVTAPPARLAYRQIPPADYRLEVTATNWLAQGREFARFDFRARHPAPAATTPPQGTAFVLHGYGLHGETMLPWALWLGERGWHVVLVDLRGHGRSSGPQVGFGPLEAADLDQLLHHLQARGEAPGPVLALGVSYGAALALRWGAQQPAVEASVAIAPYAQLAPAILNLRADYVPWMPRWLVASATRQLPGVVGQTAAELDTETALARRPLPALFIGGGNDLVAPPADLERLWALSGPGSHLEVVRGSNHESLPFRFPALSQVAETWLAQRFPPSPPRPHQRH
jgi:pimeloyl-ACP methyl ester carboxylesterase